MKKFLIVLTFLILVVGSIFVLEKKIKVQENEDTLKKPPILIGFSLGVYQEERWLRELDLFNERVEELGAVSISFKCDQNVEVQISQIRNLISQNVKVIVVVPVDLEKLGPVLEEAHEKGIKIIAYDRLIKNTNIDYYISFNNYEIGQSQAEILLSQAPQGNYAYLGGSFLDNNASLLRAGSMSILQDKIDEGEVNLVIDQYVEKWDPSIAYTIIKDYLDNGNYLDAVVAANDGLASGVIEALKEYNLNKQVVVSGQDAELAACRRLVSKDQAMTVYKSGKNIAYKAAELAVSLAKGEEIDSNSSINNGLKDLPAYYLESTVLNVDNLRTTVIRDNLYTYSEIYEE